MNGKTFEVKVYQPSVYQPLLTVKFRPTRDWGFPREFRNFGFESASGSSYIVNGKDKASAACDYLIENGYECENIAELLNA